MTESLERVFVFNKKELPDPDISLTPKKVKEIYSSEYPELATAAVTGPEIRNNKAYYSFNKSYKPKG